MYLKGGKLCHPKNMLHWHKDYFELKTTGKKQVQEKLPALPLFDLRQKLSKVFLLSSLPTRTKVNHWGKVYILSPWKRQQRNLHKCLY